MGEKERKMKEKKIKRNNNAAYYTTAAKKKLHLDPRRALKTKGVSSRRQSKITTHKRAGLYGVSERDGSRHNGAAGYCWGWCRITIASWLLCMYPELEALHHLRSLPVRFREMCLGVLWAAKIEKICCSCRWPGLGPKSLRRLKGNNPV